MLFCFGFCLLRGLYLVYFVFNSCLDDLLLCLELCFFVGYLLFCCWVVLRTLCCEFMVGRRFYVGFCLDVCWTTGLLQLVCFRS